MALSSGALLVSLGISCCAEAPDPVTGEGGTIRESPSGQVLLDDRSSEEGFERIFNGQDLTGWVGNPKLWSVRDGAITGQSTPENPVRANTFLIWTNGTLTDFELRCSFRLSPNNPQGFANSGIQYRSKVLDPINWVVGGYQADMDAGTNYYTGMLYEERFRGVMALRGEKAVWDKDCTKHVTGMVSSPAEIEASLKPGGWNDYVIIAQGNHLRQFINGKPTVDVTDECESKRALSGVLALQMHVGAPFAVQFRNLRLKQLGTKGPAKADGADLEKIQGSWQVEAIEADGNKLPSEDVTNMMLVIKGNEYTLMRGEAREDGGSFTLAPDNQPKRMDVRPKHSPNEDQILPAIYEVAGDTMRFCCALHGTERPTVFATKEDSGQVLVTYKRKK
jgi:uncharacterized protein (TIGR03067 family)